MGNSFQLLDTIIKSRLLSLNDLGYEEIMGIDVDSFRKRYKDVSDEKLNVIYEAFSESLTENDAYGPEYMINSYIKASDVFNSVNFNWGRNKQLASRKKFCRWMFKQAYLSNPNLYEEKYSPKDDDWALFKLFKPDPDDPKELIDIVFTMLLTFKIIKPFGSDSVRALQYPTGLPHRENMIKLLKLLQNDLPSFGVYKSLFSLESALKMLSDTEFDDSKFPPAAYWGILDNISCELAVNSSPKELSDTNVELDGYVMRGIWIDDCNDGQKRFWIFPNNKQMAFCYYFKNGEWILRPYEFGFRKKESICIIATLEGNKQVFSQGKLKNEELASLRYELDDRDEEGRFQTIRFTPESGSDFPIWMYWRCFCRVNLKDKRFEEFSDVINSIYHKSEMFLPFNFRNEGCLLTDSPDCLIGLDSEFLYLSDIALDKGGILEKVEEDGDYPLFNYYIKLIAPNQNFNLFSIEISKRQPLYVVPRDYGFYEELDKSLNLKIRYSDKRKDILRNYNNFKEIVTAIDYNNQVTIYKNLPDNSPSILCFNNISRIFIIDEIIKLFGVRKFVSREELMNSDIFNWRDRIPTDSK